MNCSYFLNVLIYIHIYVDTIVLSIVIKSEIIYLIVTNYVDSSIPEGVIF